MHTTTQPLLRCKSCGASETFSGASPICPDEFHKYKYVISVQFSFNALINAHTAADIVKKVLLEKGVPVSVVEWGGYVSVSEGVITSKNDNKSSVRTYTWRGNTNPTEVQASASVSTQDNWQRESQIKQIWTGGDTPVAAFTKPINEKDEFAQPKRKIRIKD